MTMFFNQKELVPRDEISNLSNWKRIPYLHMKREPNLAITHGKINKGTNKGESF